MKYLLYICTALFLVNCTPKVAEQVQETPMVDKAWRANAPEAGPARAIKMGEYNVFDLENGLKVIIVENHKLPRVSYQLSLRNLPVPEGDQVGYQGFAGSLMSRGTMTKSKADIDKAVDFIGASMNTSPNGVFGSSLTKHQDKLLEIMTDVLYNPSFPQEEFEKLKTQALSGIQTAKTDPNSMAGNIASVVNYGADHPYGEVQTEETINNIQLDNCKAYYKTYFKPNNAYLTIVGDITPEQAKETAMKYFGAWKAGDIPEHKYEMPQRPSEPRVCIANKDGAVQSVIRVTYPVDLKPGSDGVTAASVMNSILGGGIFSGRLMQNLREDKAYTYGARSSLSSDRLVGSFNASASVRNEVTDSSVHEFIYEMERIANEPVDVPDLQLAKNSMGGGFARSLESPQTIARFARNIVRYNLPQDYYETYLSRLEAVSVEDVQMAAQKYITPQNANIIVVGAKDDISEKLVKFDGDGEIEYFDAYGNKLDMNAAAIPAGVTAETVISDYLNAIGGMDKIKAVSTLEMHYGMNVMGQAVNIDMFLKAPNMMAMKVGNDAMVMQESKFNGTKALVGGMGQKQVVTEGPIFEDTKSQATMFSQLEYLGDDYTIELKSIEDVDGVACYKLSVTSPDGSTKTEFYDVKSNLLIREVQVREAGPGNSVTITQDFKDYKEVEGGITFPHKMVTSGAMPVPMEMNATSITVNGEIDDALFIIE